MDHLNKYKYYKLRSSHSALEYRKLRLTKHVFIIYIGIQPLLFFPQRGERSSPLLLLPRETIRSNDKLVYDFMKTC